MAHHFALHVDEFSSSAECTFLSKKELSLKNILIFYINESSNSMGNLSLGFCASFQTSKRFVCTCIFIIPFHLAYPFLITWDNINTILKKFSVNVSRKQWRFLKRKVEVQDWTLIKFQARKLNLLWAWSLPQSLVAFLFPPLFRWVFLFFNTGRLTPTSWSSKVHFPCWKGQSPRSSNNFLPTSLLSNALFSARLVSSILKKSVSLPI